MKSEKEKRNKDDQKEGSTVSKIKKTKNEGKIND